MIWKGKGDEAGVELVIGNGEGVLGQGVEEVVAKNDEGIFEGGVGLVGEVEV